jgi:AraC-like DNA-binding protein
MLWVRGLLNAAELVGIEQSEILSKAGVSAQEVGDQAGRLSLDKMVRIWRAGEALSADPLFGFHMGLHLRPTHFQLVAFTMLSSETLSEALEKIMKYQRLISDGGEIDVYPEGDLACLVYKPARSDFSYHQIDVALVAIVAFTRWLLNKEAVVEKVAVKHANTLGTMEYEAFFGSSVSFNSDKNALYFEPQLLQERLPGHDSGLAAMHEQLADSQLQRLSVVSIVGQVQQILSKPGQMLLSRDEVAQQLAMSGRSLQRKLQEESISFQQIQDQLRHQTALKLLNDADTSLAEIAEHLGFAESSTFYRAFKRWEGVTPGEFRQTLKA